MKSAICLSALIVLGILAISPTSGYESLYGRTFSLFNLLQNPQTQLKSLLSRYSTLDAAFNFLTSQFSSLQSQITSLASQISALTTRVNTLTQPKCSSTAPSTAQIVSGKCYQVFTNALTFAAARDVCTFGGGKLAEPLPADAPALWTALQRAFSVPDTVNTGVWLGFTQGTGTGVTITTAFTALSNPGVIVATTFFKTTPPIVVGTEVNNAAVLDTPTPVAATPFFSLDSLDAANKRPFICQY